MRMGTGLLIGIMLLSGAVSVGAQVTYKTVTAKKKGVVSSAKMPVFRAKTPVAALANQTLFAFVKKGQTAFLKENSAPPKGFPVPDYSQEYIAKTHYNYAPRLISVEVGVSFYTGGAHPGYAVQCFNFGNIDGKVKRLGLLDLFSKKAEATDTRQQIKDALLNKLHSLKDIASFVKDGTVTDLTNAQLDNFVILSDGLEFIFSPYEVGSWAEGTITVKLSVSELGSEFRKMLLFAR
ncbi:MAG: DUF3298 domain-containing protein [Chthonomonadaceae bacterium]|nr:DUF3298 domain-containing protein [Chthonomonadaceae bacterium]